MGRSAHAQPQPGKTVGPEMLDDALQTVVAAGAPARTETDPARREGDLVGHDKDTLRGDLIEVRQRTDRLAGEIHVGLRLYQQDLPAAESAAGRQGAVLQTPDRRAAALRDHIADGPAHIVARPVVLCARVAQKDEHPLDASGSLTEKHALLEQRRNGDFLVNALDRLGEQGSHGYIGDLVDAGLIGGIGDRVAELQLLDRAGLDALDGRLGEHAVGGAGVDLLGPADLHQGFCGAAERAGGVDHVVEKDDGLARDVADDVHDLGLVGDLAALVHDGQVRSQLHGELTGAGHAAHVRRDDHHVGVVLAELFEIILGEQGSPAQVVHGYIEKALDLVGVKVHGQHPVGAGGGDQVGDELRRNGIAAFGFAVLPGIAEIGDNGRDASGGSAAHRVGHDQKLHQIVVDGLAGGLNDKHIRSADRLIDGDGALTVGKALDLGFPEGLVEKRAYAFRQGGVGVSGEDLDFFPVRDQIKSPFLSFPEAALSPPPSFFSQTVYHRFCGRKAKNMKVSGLYKQRIIVYNTIAF